MLFLCLRIHHAMMACGEAVVKLHIFLTLGLYGPGQLQATNPFNAVLSNRRLGGPQTWLEWSEVGKISSLDGSQTPNFSLWYIMLVTVYNQKMLAYKCLTKSSLKDSEVDKQYSLHRFELFMAVLLRIHIFWNVTLCHWGSGYWHI